MPRYAPNKQVSRLCLMLALFVLVGFNSVRAQDEYAAVLRINYAGVEIRRANTERWLRMDTTAEMPFGAGDSVRTDASGRALLTFLDKVEVFILPDTIFELTAFDAAQASARMRGITIIHTMGETPSFQLETNLLTVSRPAEAFAVWAQDEELSAMTVAQGQAEVRANDQVFQVTEGQGLRAGLLGQPDTLDLDLPFNAARLIGLLDGCPGSIRTVENLNVNVRVGPDLDSTVIGNIPNGEAVRVLAVDEWRGWYRIQAFSGFGWVQQRLVQHACENLLVLPSNTVEFNIGVFQITPAELAFLEPFYGAPQDDLWFYRSLRDDL